MCLTRFLGNYRIDILHKSTDYRYNQSNEIRYEIRNIIYTTNLTTTPESYLHKLIDILYVYMPIESSAVYFKEKDRNLAYGLYGQNKTGEDNTSNLPYKTDNKFTFHLIAKVFIGKNDVYYPNIVDVNSSKMVWEIMLELLRRCDEEPFYTGHIFKELYQDVIDHCCDIISNTNDETILTVCGLMIMYILKNNNKKRFSTDKLIVVPNLDENAIAKIKSICNDDFRGELLVYDVLYNNQNE